MAPLRSFADYPGAKEATNISYKIEEDKNPTLRGLALVIGAAVVVRIPWLQRFLYSNAGFSKLSSIEGLADQRWRFDPTVIPLWDGSEPAPPIFEPKLLEPQSADLPSRWYSIADYHALYKAGQTTPLQVVEALLPLIDPSHSPRSEYSTAWLDIHVHSVLAAARASTERYAAGKPLSPLDGVPFGVKADCDVEGYVSTMGMAIDTRHAYFTQPADHSLWPVAKLEEAGAVMVGKMNQHEIGMDTTGCNPNTGTPINWTNRAYYPGGSSSGAGSALGAGLVPICVGTDAGGSIRIPTATAGQVALKPSHSRTVAVHSTMCIVGPMASNVADLTIAYRLMAQPPDVVDEPVQGMFAPSIPPNPQSTNGEKKLLGICYPWVNRATAEVRAVFDRAVEHFTKDLGYEIVDIDLPLLREGQVAHGAVNLAEAADKAKARHGGNGAPGTWLDMLSAPNKVVAAVGSQTTANDYMRFSQVRSVIMQHLAHLFETHGAGLLIASPTMPDAGYTVHPGDARYGFTDGNRTLRSMMYVWLSNMSGCPSATVPVGYVDPQRGEGRLPVGMLAMGMWGEEERLLGWAAEGEAYLKGRRERPEGWVDVIGLAAKSVEEAAA